MLINVQDTNKKLKSISVNESDSFDTLKEKAKKKLQLDYEINKFHCIENGIIIDDDDILREFWTLVKPESVYTLVALKENENYEPPKEKKASKSDDDFVYLPSILNTVSKLDTSSNDKFLLIKKELDSIKGKLENRSNGDSISDDDSISVIESIRKGEKDCEELSEKIERKKSDMTDRLREIEKKKKKMNDDYIRIMYESKELREARTADLNRLELKKVDLELRKAKISKLILDLKDAEKVDLCFMVDGTGSMVSYILEAKTVIHRLVERLARKFEDFQLRCAFVCYRDHCDGSNRVEVLSFTSDKDAFKDWVTNLEAIGGGDECEDVFGGLEEVNKLEWINMSRVLFHIGDAPCHGRRFHDGANDNYPDGDPRGLDIDNLIKGIASKNIEYYFAEINESTTKMIDQFGVILEDSGRDIKIVKLASSKDLLDTLSSSIISSITASKSLSIHDGHGKQLKPYKVDPSPIDWSLDSAKFEKFKADLYETDFSSSLLNIKDSQVKYEKRKVDIWLAKQPFAKGCVRLAFAALIDLGTIESPNLVRVVMKGSIFKEAKYNTMKYCKGIIEVQVISKLIAEEFMKEMSSLEDVDVDEEGEVKFLDVDLVYVENTGTYYSIEPFVEGKFKKWNNNFGVVNEDDYSARLNAFSHWTYQATEEYLIVADLQGFKSERDYLLTDPAIICADDWDRFSSTNLAKDGIKNFFKSHRCNKVCEKLKLKKHKYQTHEKVSLPIVLSELDPTEHNNNNNNVPINATEPEPTERTE